MKGLVGIVLAAVLGLLGAACNWFYLQRAVQFQEQVTFIGIRPTVHLNVGDLITEEHIERIEIPRVAVGNLMHVAPQWSAKDAVLGHRATRPYMGGEIILEMDLVTPVQQDLASTLNENEVARWVPIDPRSVIPDQINPGDLVSFEVATAAFLSAPSLPMTPPTTPPGTEPPNEEGPSGGAAASPPVVARPSVATPGPGPGPEIIGPFRVLALGNRRERREIQLAGRGRGGPENTITILVRMNGNKLEPKAAKLFEAIRAGRNATVQLHSSKARE